ncbi:hypothetical protein DRN46_00290 [Thermococci archaeon]|nr:MAG: hypothetical protein DRN46_00290 [Thermococci archaeon]
MDFTQARTYGGVGALLSFMGYIGTIMFPGSIILSVIGAILILVAVRMISSELEDEPIFTNYLISFILGITSIAVLFAGLIVAGLSLFGASILGLITSIVVFGVAFILLEIASAFFLWRSYKRISSGTGVQLFETVGLLYFIGALTLVIIVGMLVSFIAAILEIVAYFSLPFKLEKSQSKDEGRPEVVGYEPDPS